MSPRKGRRIVADATDSSASDSEDDSTVAAHNRWAGRGRFPPAPAPVAALMNTTNTSSTTSPDNKKKKKRRLPPQESIDRVWERFAQKRFSKAMTVLPFAPVAPSPLSDRANELLRLGYDRAVEECRRKVLKIITECRRVNMRYRDPGWDIDWDLKMGRGHCLNSLGKNTFDVSIKNMTRIKASVPKAVKRVHEIFEKPTFMANVSGSDVKQGNLGDCWFISCVSGLANVPGGLQRSCVKYDTKIGIYGFVFYRDGEWIYSIIDDKLYLTSPSWDSRSFQRDLLQQVDQDNNTERVYRKTYQTGSKALFFAQNKDQNETWLPLMEKAYAKAHGDYDSLIGGWTGEGLEDLTGGVTTELLTSDIMDTDSFWEQELSRVNDEFLFGCSTGLLDVGYGSRDGIAEGHAYNLMEARTLRNGTRLLKLRNPWGRIKTGNWEGAWSDGSKEWTAEVQAELGHTFGGDSTFWIAYEDFLLKYQHIDRTRLFRDPDWRCCQRWIGVDVAWKAAYHEKFHIKLTRASPVVLVLSQLDTRYFQGLVGQYLFRLHFRLHEQDRPDAEDYIVRSHGNYLMDRAVSVELPELPAGNYAVVLSVSAERETSAPAVEDVIKRELQHRAENEKLSQVGQAYDLAHSKAAAHLTELAKQRKMADQTAASTERKVERRKAWAKRHLLKDIQKRQQAKNERKKARDKAKEKKRDVAPVPQDKEEQIRTPEAGPQAADVISLSSGSSTPHTPHATPLETPTSESHSQPLLDAASSLVLEPSVEAKGKKTEDDEKKQEQQDKKESKEENKCPVCGSDKDKDKESSSASAKPRPVEDDSSSDSPIDDWEEWYSSDDLSTKASRAAAAAATAAATSTTANTATGTNKDEEDSEDERDTMPWNAICVVGIRVYSKDEYLELRVVMEGGTLSEGGMGARGEQDLDNAQSNAGGQRVKEEVVEEKGKDKEDKEMKEKEGEEEKGKGKENEEKDREEEEKQEKEDQASTKDANVSKPDGKDETTTESAPIETTNGATDAKESETKTSTSGDGLAQYTTIVQKDGEEFEKASAPVPVVMNS